MNTCTCTESQEYFDYQMMPFLIFNKKCETHRYTYRHKPNKRTGRKSYFTTTEKEWIISNATHKIKELVKRFYSLFGRTISTTSVRTIYDKNGIQVNYFLNKIKPERQKFIIDNIDLSSRILCRKYKKHFESLMPNAKIIEVREALRDKSNRL